MKNMAWPLASLTDCNSTNSRIPGASISMACDHLTSSLLVSVRPVPSRSTASSRSYPSPGCVAMVTQAVAGGEAFRLLSLAVTVTI